MTEPAFCIDVKTKAQISCMVTAQVISIFLFTTLIVESLYFLNSKFQASTRLSPVVVQPGLCKTLSETPKTGFLEMSLIEEQLFAPISLADNGEIICHVIYVIIAFSNHRQP